MKEKDGADAPSLEALADPLYDSAHKLANRNGAVHDAVESSVSPESAAALLANLTDAGNATWLAALYRNDLLFQYDRGIWRVFDGVIWREDRDGEIMRRAEAAVREMLRVAATLKGDDAKRLGEHATRSLSRRALEAMVALAQSKLPALSEQFDADPYLLAVENGVVDLRDCTFRQARREDYLTRCAGTAYDPDAKAPLWERFLDRIFNSDAEMINFLQIGCGYSLSGLTSEQVWFLLHGLGQNGKSELLKAIRRVFGTYAAHTATETLLQAKGPRPTNSLAALKNARLVTAIESDENRRLATGLIKQLSGDDPVTARFLYGEDFTFAPEFKIWFATNHLPRNSDSTVAQWRRIRLIPFKVQISEEERDKTLGEKLALEAPGILNWAFDGFRRWRTVGLPKPAAVVEATAAYRADQDPIADFIADCCEVAETYSETVGALYDAYKLWCSAAGECEPIAKRDFSARLGEHGFATRRVSKVRFRDGIRLKNHDEVMTHDAS